MPDITDEQIVAFARHAADRIPESNYEGRVIHAVRMALSTPPAATPASTGERERALFEGKFKHLGFARKRGAWGEEIYAAQPVQDLWEGWQARAALAQPAPVAAPADPMDWPLPCDVTVGHGTMRKGVSLRTLVTRMKALYEMATGNDADVVAAPAPAASAPVISVEDSLRTRLRWSQERVEQLEEENRQMRGKLSGAKLEDLLLGASPSTPEPAAASGAVAEGWQMVPVEPTDDMLYAIQDGAHILPPRGRRIWAMLLKATPPQAGKGEA